MLLQLIPPQQFAELANALHGTFEIFEGTIELKSTAGTVLATITICSDDGEPQDATAGVQCFLHQTFLAPAFRSS